MIKPGKPKKTIFYTFIPIISQNLNYWPLDILFIITKNNSN